jgi:hypothetical protein
MTAKKTADVAYGSKLGSAGRDRSATDVRSAPKGTSYLRRKSGSASASSATSLQARAISCRIFCTLRQTRDIDQAFSSGVTPCSERENSGPKKRSGRFGLQHYFNALRSCCRSACDSLRTRLYRSRPWRNAHQEYLARSGCACSRWPTIHTTMATMPTSVSNAMNGPCYHATSKNWDAILGDASEYEHLS